MKTSVKNALKKVPVLAKAYSHRDELRAIVKGVWRGFNYDPMKSSRTPENRQAQQTDQRVTWLLPVKNGMPYIRETLASIERQTYTNWEIIVWDNGSTDGTLEELKKWIPSRLPGRIVSDRPLSLGNSLAALVEVASTELCARIDADDLNHPARLEKQVAYLRLNPRVGVVGTQLVLIDADGNEKAGAWRQPLTDAEIRWGLRWENSINHPTALFRRSIVLSAGNYSDCMPYEDYDLWMRMSVSTEMGNLPEVLLEYRRLESSVTGGGKNHTQLSYDAVANRNDRILFSDVEGPAALEFRQHVSIDSVDLVNFGHIFALRRVARATALSLGKPRDYFSSTNLYSEQRQHLIRRVIEQTSLGRVFFAIKRSTQRRLKSL